MLRFEANTRRTENRRASQGDAPLIYLTPSLSYSLQEVCITCADAHRKGKYCEIERALVELTLYYLSSIFNPRLDMRANFAQPSRALTVHYHFHRRAQHSFPRSSVRARVSRVWDGVCLWKHYSLKIPSQSVVKVHIHLQIPNENTHILQFPYIGALLR